MKMFRYLLALTFASALFSVAYADDCCDKKDGCDKKTEKKEEKKEEKKN